MDSQFRSHCSAHAYVLTVYTALRPPNQGGGSVSLGRNGYRYSCSETGLWYPCGPIGRQDWAEAGHLPAHAAMVCLQPTACIFDRSEHAVPSAFLVTLLQLTVILVLSSLTVPLIPAGSLGAMLSEGITTLLI